MQLLVQNLWNFSSEQRAGMTMVLSSRRKDNQMIVQPPKTTINTNPYLASFLTGVLVREWNKKGIAGLSSVLESTLAVQGDDLYWRVLRPTALFAGMVLVILGQPLAGLLSFLIGFNLFAQGERLVGYVRGLKKGKKGLSDVMHSLASIKKIALTLSAGLVGFLCAAMIFNLNSSNNLLNSGQWFLFLPFLGLSLLFAILKISPLFNLLANLFIMVLLGVFI